MKSASPKWRTGERAEASDEDIATTTSLEAAQVRVRHYRRPWYWLVLAVLGAAVATALLVANARARAEQNDRQFVTSAQVRLKNVEILIDDYFGKAIQLARTGAEAIAPVERDQARAKLIVDQLFTSIAAPEIYGLGPFYVPYAFDPRARLFVIYELREGSHKPEQLLFSPGDYDYTRYRWYRRTLANRKMTWDGPYWEDGKSFISTVEPFYRNGRLVGMMTVDTLTGTFKRLMSTPLAAGDVAWIENSAHGHWLLGTAPRPQPGAAAIDQRVPMRYTGAYVHVIADATAVRAANARLMQISYALVAVVWLIAIGAIVAIVRMWTVRERAIASELERARLANEIAVAKTVEGELRKAAYTDALTGLPSRTPFLERVADAILARKDGKPASIFFIDLDRFNRVNDTLGHIAGDRMLRAVAARLVATLDETAVAARLGGDEFVVLAPVEREDSGRFAERLLDVLREPIELDGRRMHTAASIGVVILEPGYERPEEPLRDADIAMYQAKRLGRDRFATFDAAMRSRIASETELEDDLRHAIDRREFIAYYQPLIEIASGTIVSFEALVRWQRPSQGLVLPGTFIGFAETHGLVETIDAQMLDIVCADIPAILEAFPEATVAVNVSAAHLGEPGIADDVAVTLARHGIPPERLKLEITETAVMANAVRARASLERLRDAGLQVVLDDFGQGQSSLAYLQRLPIASLKIDRAFVEPLPHDVQAIAIVRSIIGLARTLGLETVAEGVETRAQLDVLAGLGATYAQGFFFSRPLPLAELLAKAKTNAVAGG